MLTVVYVITYRLDKKSSQEEQTRFTKEAADNFAQAIIDLSGVAVVTEDIRDVPETLNDDLQTIPAPKGLIWEDEHDR
jgi:hypothetical protein